MQISKLFLASILCVAIALPVYAAEEMLVKCFGAAMVHKSDCDTNNNPDTCNPMVIQGEPDYWVYLPQSVCEKIVGPIDIKNAAPAND